MKYSLDTQDEAYIHNAMIHRSGITGPIVGDYIEFASGQIERVCEEWTGTGRVQTSEGGSFFLCASGNASFSGGCNPSIPISTLKKTNETRLGTFWIFHHGFAGAGCGIDFQMPVTVWKTDAPYWR